VARREDEEEGLSGVAQLPYHATGRVPLKNYLLPDDYE
jgi:hypothetical protein